jgi:transposase
MIEGAVDSTLFENFLYRVLNKLRLRADTKGKTIVVLMDNARIHMSQKIEATASKMGAVVLFNAQYSPWLNPIE